MRILPTILFSIFFIFSALKDAKSQSYIPLLNDSFYWDIGNANNLSVTFCQEYGTSGPYRYRTLRDTIFNATSYKMFAVYSFHKVYPWYPYNCPPFYVDTLFGELLNGPYLREDIFAQKVFILDSANATERIMFDFSAQIGDTINYPMYGDFIVDTIYNYTSMDGVVRRVFNANGWISPYGRDFYMEGIGGAGGLFFDPFAYFEGGPWLMCVSDLNDSIILGYSYYPFVVNFTEHVIESKILIYPNPASDYLYVGTDETVNEYIIYDSSGKIFQKSVFDEGKISVSDLQPGYYFLTTFKKGIIKPVGGFVKS